MKLSEPATSTEHRLIDIHEFDTCLIDGTTRKQICQMYPGKGVYYLKRFDRFLQEKYGMTIKDYVVRYGGIVWPKCPESGRDVGYSTGSGKGLIVRRYAFHAGVTMRASAAVRENAERMKVERVGAGNPMHGKTPWNTGLTAETDVRLAGVAEALTGREVAEETREKQRAARAKSPLKARHTTPHTLESRQKMRFATAKRWAEGKFAQGATLIHGKMRQFLNSLDLRERYKEEHQEIYYSIDFAFPRAKVAIECDGDYFHVNPQFYPDGPKDAIQRRNAGRDKSKNSFLRNRGWTVIRVWECDINAGVYKESLICKLKELGLLNH